MLAIYAREFEQHGCINCGCKNIDNLETYKNEYFVKCEACGFEFAIFASPSCKENSIPLYRAKKAPCLERPILISHPRRLKAWELERPKDGIWNIDIIDHDDKSITIMTENSRDAEYLHDTIKEVTQAAVPYSILLFNDAAYLCGCKISRNEFNILALYDYISKDKRLTKEMLEKTVLNPDKIKIRRAKSRIEKYDNLDKDSFREALYERLSDYKRFFVSFINYNEYYPNPYGVVLPHEAIGYACNVTDDYITIYPGVYYEMLKEYTEKNLIEAVIDGAVITCGSFFADSDKECITRKVRKITRVVIRGRGEVIE